MLSGRPPAYEALCTHLDIVELPAGSVVLASNLLAPVQAAEIGTFWGVQYHPEYSFSEVAAIIERRAEALVSEGFVANAATARDYARDLRGLDGDAGAA